MNDEYRNDLDEMLRQVYNELSETETGTEQRSRTISDYKELCELRQKLEMIDNDFYDKAERRRMDDEKREAELKMREKELETLISNTKKTNRIQLLTTLIPTGIMAATFTGNVIIEKKGEIGSNLNQLFRFVRR